MKGDKQETGPVRLNANENFYGCSSSVLQAVRKALKNIPRYPSAPVKLEEALAARYGVDRENIVAGAGSVRHIEGIIQTFSEPGDEILMFERSFSAYEFLASAHGRKPVFVNQDGFSCIPASAISHLSPKTRVIFLANPNNPTGTIFSHTQLKELLEKVPEHVLVVSDEAYAEYVTDPTYPDSFSLLKEFHNLIILRTFSKIYGLAGLRTGYAVCRKDPAEALKKNRIPFFFNSLSEAAALAALGDSAFIEKCAKRNERERKFLYRNLKKMSLVTVPSQGNFLYLHFDSEDGKEKIFRHFLDAGLLVCNMKVFGLPAALRVTIGDRGISERLVGALAGKQG